MSLLLVKGGISQICNWRRTCQNGQCQSRWNSKVAPTKTVTQLWSFLGFCNYYHQFIDHYSNICQSLNVLLQKSKLWDWAPIQHTTFENLKVAFVSKLVLLMPDYLKPFEMKCDASLFATRGVLLSAAKVQFRTAVRTWTSLNRTKSLVQSSWKSLNRTYGPVQGLSIPCFCWTGSNLFEPYQNSCDFCCDGSLISHTATTDCGNPTLSFDTHGLLPPSSPHHHQPPPFRHQHTAKVGEGKNVGVKVRLHLFFLCSFLFIYLKVRCDEKLLIVSRWQCSKPSVPLEHDKTSTKGVLSCSLPSCALRAWHDTSHRCPVLLNAFLHPTSMTWHLWEVSCRVHCLLALHEHNMAPLIGAVLCSLPFYTLWAWHDTYESVVSCSLAPCALRAWHNTSHRCHVVPVAFLRPTSTIQHLRELV